MNSSQKNYYKNMAKYDDILQKYQGGGGNKKSSSEIKGSGKYDDILSKYKKKRTTGQAIMNVADKVTDFVGGRALAEGIGAGIARSRATEDEKQYIESPTGKQIAASAGRVALNIGTLAMGAGPAQAVGSKVSAGLLGGGVKLTPQAIRTAKIAGKTLPFALEGGAFLGADTALKEIEEGKKLSDEGVWKNIRKNALIGTGVGAALPLAVSGAGKLFSRSPKVATSIARKADEVVRPGSRATVPGVEQAAVGSDVTTGLVDSTGKVKLRELLTRLEKGYGRDDVVKIAGELYEKNPSGVFSPSEVAEVASKYKPVRELPGVVRTPKNKPPRVPVARETSEQAPVRPVEAPKTPSETIKPKAGTKPKNKVAKALSDEFEDVSEKASRGEATSDSFYEASTLKEWEAKATQVIENNSVDDILDTLYTDTPKVVLPDGMPKEALRRTLQKTEGLSGKQISRLANGLRSSQAGAELRATQMGGDIFEKIAAVNAKMQRNLSKKGYTAKSITDFLDDNICPS